MRVTTHPLEAHDADAMRAIREELAAEPPLALDPEMRPALDELVARTPSANVAYEEAEVGGVHGWWCRPPDASRDAAILHLHGGGYVMGSAYAFRHFAGQLAERAQVAAFVPEYRLAPEHAFPAALGDAHSAVHGLIDAGFERIALVGDSAGGGLVLALLSGVRTREVVGAVVFSPWLDLALTGDSLQTRAGADPLLWRETLDHAAELYLGGRNRRDPLASPLYGDLDDLPPILVHVGEDEVLLDDSIRLAERCPSVELHVWQGMVHVFPSNPAVLDAAREADDQVGEFLRRLLY
jgi:acetyl esterase/lipase